MRPQIGQGNLQDRRSWTFFRNTLLSLFAVAVFQNLTFSQFKQVHTETQKQVETIEQFVQHGMPVRFPHRTSVRERSELKHLAEKHLFADPQLQMKMFDSAMFVPLPGPSGGSVRSIAVDQGGWLFIATDGEVYRSTDNGLHWDMNLFPSQLHSAVEPVTVLGPNVIVAESEFYNFISTDRGDSWNFLLQDVQGFAIDTNGIIYAGSNYGGVKKSTDTAKSWVPFALAGKKIWRVVLCGEGKFACPSDSGIYFSSDTGLTWIYRPYETAYTWNLVSDKRGRLFALRYYGLDFELYRSTDFGQTWRRITLPVSGDAYRVYVENDGRVWVCIARNILTSIDGGDTWTVLTFPIGLALTVGRDAEGNLLAGSFYGIYRRNDMNGEWEEINNGIHARRIERIQFTSTGSIFVQSLGSWFRSTDGGNTWSVIQFDSTITGLNAYAPILSSRSGSIFIAAAFDNQCGFLRSTDDGVSWRKISVLSNFYFFYGLAESSTGDLYAVDGYNNIYHSSNGGDSWRRVLSGTAYVIPITLGIAADNFGNCYVAKDSTILTLRNGAVSNEISLKRNPADYESMSIDTRGEVFLGSSYNGVYHSSDTGKSWNLLNGNLFDRYVISTTSDDSGNVILGTASGIFRLADSIDSWLRFSDGFPRTFATSLAISPEGYLFAGTQDFGIYKTRAPLGKRIPRIEHPPPPSNILDFRLYQNYPNPFNNQTLIKYQVPSFARVVLKVYNILGQVVTTLISTELPEGQYDVVWSPDQVASGIYFCEMRASSSSTTYRTAIKLLYLR